MVLNGGPSPWNTRSVRNLTSTGKISLKPLSSGFFLYSHEVWETAQKLDELLLLLER
jgi:hypothetical protein